MAFKWIAIFWAGLLWGLGADIDFTVAFGLGGTAVFLLTALVAGSLFWYKAFRRKKSPLELWIGIFRGLIVETLVFPVAGLIFGLTSPEVPGPNLGFSHLLIYSGSAFVGVLLLLALSLLVHLLKARLTKQKSRLVPERAKKVKDKP